MDTIQKIQQFLNYAQYDPNQKKFKFGSKAHELHTICNKVKEFMELDPSGIFAVIYIKKALKSFFTHITINALQLFENPDALNAEKQIWNTFNTPEVQELEKHTVDVINNIVLKINNGRILGERNVSQEIEVMEEILSGTISDLNTCNKEIYLKGGDLLPIKNFSNKITVFDTTTDCVLALETAPDGMYLCYIDYNKSADGYFGFFIKNNGNIFSINDRVIERFPGEHDIARNGRWMEDKKTELFPYNYIFEYSEHDYKGYANTFDIQDDKLEFFNLGAEVYMPIVIAMSLLSQTYSCGTTPKMSNVHCNTLLESNLLTTPNLPATVNNSSIATQTRNINIQLDMDRIMSAEYSKTFSNGEYYYERGVFPEEQSLFVEMYGQDFVFNEEKALSTTTAITHYNNKTNSRHEFIATEQQLKLVAYKQARQQLAEYIREKMNEELANFGGMPQVHKWYHNALNARKDEILTLFIKIYSSAPLSSEEQNLAKLIGVSDCNDSGYGNLPLNEVANLSRKVTFCPVNGRAPNVQITFTPRNWQDIEKLTGPVPKIIRGWDTELRGTGNPMLNVTDAVSFVGTPFEKYEHDINKRLWDEHDWHHMIWRANGAEQEELRAEKQKYQDYEHSEVMNFAFSVKLSKSGIKQFAKQHGIRKE